MKQESTIGPNGKRHFRFIAQLENDKEIVTWAETKGEAERKVINKRGSCKTIREAGNPLEDRPKQ